jgi:lipopolysaccharide export LptBFGC system permease protein LptF
MEEIITTAITCFVLTLIGLALGFGLLRVQGN